MAGLQVKERWVAEPTLEPVINYTACRRSERSIFRALAPHAQSANPFGSVFGVFSHFPASALLPHASSVLWPLCFCSLCPTASSSHSPSGVVCCQSLDQNPAKALLLGTEAAVFPTVSAPCPDWALLPL